jgi:hypothetical protein
MEILLNTKRLESSLYRQPSLTSFEVNEESSFDCFDSAKSHRLAVNHEVTSECQTSQKGINPGPERKYVI